MWVYTILLKSIDLLGRFDRDYRIRGKLKYKEVIYVEKKILKLKYLGFKLGCYLFIYLVRKGSELNGFRRYNFYNIRGFVFIKRGFICF